MKHVMRRSYVAISFLSVIWKTYINMQVPSLQYDEDFLRHDFIPTMLNSLGKDIKSKNKQINMLMIFRTGLHDDSGVVFEILEHDYFSLEELGNWDLMMPGMINVSVCIIKG